MPWEHCGGTITDDTVSCPACGITKRAWTVKFAATRVFSLGRAWVELAVVEAPERRPVPGLPYVVELKTGASTQGELSEDGDARLEQIPRGACTILFPTLDAGDFEPEQAGVSVSFDVVDGRGRPVAWEPFRVTAGGRTAYGALDGAGRATVWLAGVDPLDADECTIELLDLDEGDFLVEET
ncbi:MAG: hypothetical protein KF878_20455 [Planctomycetes bacterium]|nr:hypothetical protein [Planctomycetota bacterium]